MHTITLRWRDCPPHELPAVIVTRDGRHLVPLTVEHVDDSGELPEWELTLGEPEHHPAPPPE